MTALLAVAALLGALSLVAVAAVLVTDWAEDRHRRRKAAERRARAEEWLPPKGQRS